MRNIKNIAIIAHVDHGKTTLVDKLLQASGTFRENEEVVECVMDSNAIERERGITILAKTTAIDYKGYRINILDTPGHADFGGEVERIMNMVNGVLLVVDAYEGPMPQTRFVLKKALEAGVTPILVVNKIDKPAARPKQVVDEVMDLFIDLGASLEQLEFPVIYASGIAGTSSLDPDPSTQEKTMEPILDAVLEYIPSPDTNEEGSLQFQPALLDYNDYVGRIGIGLVKRGKIKVNEMVSCVRLDGSIKQFRVQKLFGFLGLKRIEINEADAGDIVAVAGLPDISVGETVCEIGKEEALPILRIDEPTLQMTFSVNSSPFAGREGKFLTARKISDRLFKETERDVSLKVTEGDSESWVVSGRGELHLGILIENMRREGYELAVSKPEVILHEDENGIKVEPIEEVVCIAPSEYQGTIINKLNLRKGVMVNLEEENGYDRITYTAPTRGLLGFRSEFINDTHGEGTLVRRICGYEPYKGEINQRMQGAMISTETGTAMTYALWNLQERGSLFIGPQTEVYEGMIIGESAKNIDMDVNPLKNKKLTAIRSSGRDEAMLLTPPRIFSLEEALEWINDDELVEVTPDAIRIRKKGLTAIERRRLYRQKMDQEG